MKKWTILILSVCLAVCMLTACGKKKDEPETTATPTATGTAKPTASATPEATAEPKPTTEPTSSPDADPEVDAMLFRFWSDGEFGWENIHNVSAETGLQEGSIQIAVELEYEEDTGLKVIAQGGDPYFLIVPASDTGNSFSLADYPVLKIRMRNETPATKGEFFIARNGQNNVSAGDEIQYPISANDTEFKEYIVDLRELKGADYVDAGEISALRLDLVNLMDAKDPTAEQAYTDGEPYTVYVDYFGFFKTVADAEAWNPAHLAADTAE